MVSKFYKFRLINERRLSSLPAVRLVEVHPGGCLVLHGAPVHQVREMKSSPKARRDLHQFLAGQGVSCLPTEVSLNDHALAASACALAAWRWTEGKSAWLQPAELPLHPFDFAC